MNDHSWSLQDSLSEFRNKNQVSILNLHRKYISVLYERTAVYTVHTAVCHQILTTHKPRVLTWPSGKHRGFCIITNNKDSVRNYFRKKIEKSLSLDMVFICFPVQEFQGFIVASSPSARPGRQWEPLCSTHLRRFLYIFISLS